jgi:hypothetical protein
MLIMVIKIPNSNGLTKNLCPNININITITTKPRILEIVESMRAFNSLHLMINQFFHNHGEEQRKRILSMDSRTHLGTTLMHPKLNINTTINIIIKHKILEIVESMRAYNSLHLMINQSSLNHGEELRKHTQRMDSRTQVSIGYLNKKRETSVTKVLMRQCMDLHLMIRVYFQNHGEESLNHIQ